MKKLVLALAILPLLAFLALFAAGGNSAPPADASHLTYKIWQGSTLLGTVEPLVGVPFGQGGATPGVSNFYGYNTIFADSTKQTNPLLDGTSLLFLHKQLTDSTLNGTHPIMSLVMIHRPDIKFADMRFSGLPSKTDWFVTDDPNDVYTKVPNTSTASASWELGPSDSSDGGALRGGLDGPLCITVSGGFTTAAGRKAPWRWLNADLTLIELPLIGDITIRTEATQGTGVVPCPDIHHVVGGTAGLLDADDSVDAVVDNGGGISVGYIAALVGLVGATLIAGGWFARKRWLP